MKKIGLNDVFVIKRADGLREIMVAENGTVIAKIYGDAYKWTAFRQHYDLSPELKDLITDKNNRVLVV